MALHKTITPVTVGINGNTPGSADDIRTKAVLLNDPEVFANWYFTDIDIASNKTSILDRNIYLDDSTCVTYRVFFPSSVPDTARVDFGLIAGADTYYYAFAADGTFYADEQSSPAVNSRASMAAFPRDQWVQVGIRCQSSSFYISREDLSSGQSVSRNSGDSRIDDICFGVDAGVRISEICITESEASLSRLASRVPETVLENTFDGSIEAIQDAAVDGNGITSKTPGSAIETTFTELPAGYRVLEQHLATVVSAGGKLEEELLVLYVDDVPVGAVDTKRGDVAGGIEAFTWFYSVNPVTKLPWTQDDVTNGTVRLEHRKPDLRLTAGKIVSSSYGLSISTGVGILTDGQWADGSASWDQYYMDSTNRVIMRSIERTKWLDANKIRVVAVRMNTTTHQVNVMELDWNDTDGRYENLALSGMAYGLSTLTTVAVFVFPL